MNPFQLNGAETYITTDTMSILYYIISWIQIGKIADLSFLISGTTESSDFLPSQNIPSGDKGNLLIREFKAPGNGSSGQCDLSSFHFHGYRNPCIG